MYAKVENNQVVQANSNLGVFGLAPESTVAERQAQGVYEIIYDNTNLKDSRYYWNGAESIVFANNAVTASYAPATGKDVADKDAVDSDGNNVLDDDGNQVINYGLKTEKKRIVKQQASGLLAPTDWYVIKSNEVSDYNVPENITTFRSDVRAKSNEMETQIDACTNVDELKALYEYTTQEDGTQTRPLAEFPKEI